MLRPMRNWPVKIKSARSHISALICTSFQD
jgi:hypothetical protein